MIWLLTLIAVLIVGTALAAWSPWVTDQWAQSRATEGFADEWKNTSDGCGFNCLDCGTRDSVKVLFGRKVAIEYACGLIQRDSPEYHQRGTIFVSFIGTTSVEPPASRR